ncbi:MAG: PIG-L family deacetylase [Magnetococcales bacterium]|nr:PIG-L family deacetylase [Magnetococcales bacterium]
MHPFPRPYGSLAYRAQTLLALLNGRFSSLAKGEVLLLGCSLGTLPQYVKNLADVTNLVTVEVPASQAKPDIDTELNGMDFRSFDLVLVMDYFEDIHWGPWSLQLLQHVLKPGGHLIFTVANPLGFSYYLRRIKQKIVGIWATPEPRGATTHFFDSFPSFDSLEAMLIKLGYAPLFRATRLSMFGGIVSSLFTLVENLSRQGMKIWGDWGQQGVFVYRTAKDRTEEFPLAFADSVDNLKAKHGNHFAKEYTQLSSWLDNFPSYKNLTPISSLDTDISKGAVFVLSPHPDDELIGCGGLLLQLIKKGHKVTILQLTDGGAAAALRGVEDSLQRTIRFEEAKLVADNIKADLHCWPVAGSCLQCNDEVVDNLGQLLQLHPYSHIFVPFINDSHPDHVVANHILARVLAKNPNIMAAGAKIYSYEVWSLAPVNYLCPIDDEFGEKCDLLMHYSTGMKAVNYIYHCQLNGAYHGTRLDDDNIYAEAFLQLDPKAYQQLIEANISLASQMDHEQ